MDLFGPFKVSGRAVPTWLTPNPGDQISVLATGVVSVEPTHRQVTADGDPYLASQTWPGPTLKQFSLIGIVGNQSVQLGNGLTTLPNRNRNQTLPTGSTLYLDVNAPPDSLTPGLGWSVYIVRAAAGEIMPQLRDWVSFRDLTSFNGFVRQVSAVSLDGVIHVFWIEQPPFGNSSFLRHLAIQPDGSIDPPTIVSTTFQFSELSAVVHRGEVNVFFCVDRDPRGLQGGRLVVLRRGVLTGAGTFRLSDIDGDDRGLVAAGAISGRVGVNVAAVSDGNDLHLLYGAETDRNQPGDPGDGNGAVINDLRHARYTRVTIGGPVINAQEEAWIASTIDGAGGGAGRALGNTASGSISAILDVASQVHAFYRLGALTGRKSGFDLRHAELDWVTGNTQRWRLETLDGAGKTFANASGNQLRGDVGLGVGAALHNGELHVFYNDDTHQNLRWAMKAPGLEWHFETIDGMSDAPRDNLNYGPTTNGIRPSLKAAVSLGDQISVFYVGDFGLGVLRHAYRRPGLPWMIETVDGAFDFGGRLSGELSTPAAVVSGGRVNLFYSDFQRGRLRQAVLDLPPGHV